MFSNLSYLYQKEQDHKANAANQYSNKQLLSQKFREKQYRFQQIAISKL